MSYDEKYTLCYSCRNSYLNGCEWADELKPVPGWKAIRDDEHDSYQVVLCPKFVEECPYGSDKRTYHAKKIEDVSGMYEFAAAIIKQACKDYISNYKVWLKVEDPNARAQCKKIEDFMMSQYFGRISDLDPEVLIRNMQKKVQKAVRM